MNTGERIVESYFRYCRGCFTIPDVKIKGGNNRQIDLLAWDPKLKRAYHVESTVVPSGRYFNKSKAWKPPFVIFQNKFFGQQREKQPTEFIPPDDDTDYQKIKQTYLRYDLKPNSVIRVWVCWVLNDYGVTEDQICDYFAQRRIPRHLVEVISFRDKVVPELQRLIGSSNYEDDVLRTFSFFAERNIQLQTL